MGQAVVGKHEPNGVCNLFKFLTFETWPAITWVSILSRY